MSHYIRQKASLSLPETQSVKIGKPMSWLTNTLDGENHRSLNRTNGYESSAKWQLWPSARKENAGLANRVATEQRDSRGACTDDATRRLAGSKRSRAVRAVRASDRAVYRQQALDGHDVHCNTKRNPKEFGADAFR